MKKFLLFSSVALSFIIIFSFSSVFATTNMSKAVSNTMNDYAATRTSTTAPAKFAGMTATGWTWFIMAILGILIVAMILYYGNQKVDTHDVNNNDKQE